VSKHINFLVQNLRIVEKFFLGRFIVPERTWPGCRTFLSVTGLSRAIRASNQPTVVDTCKFPLQITQKYWLWGTKFCAL